MTEPDETPAAETEAAVETAEVDVDVAEPEAVEE